MTARAHTRLPQHLVIGFYKNVLTPTTEQHSPPTTMKVIACLFVALFMLAKSAEVRDTYWVKVQIIEYIFNYPFLAHWRGLTIRFHKWSFHQETRDSILHWLHDEVTYFAKLFISKFQVLMGDWIVSPYRLMPQNVWFPSQLKKTDTIMIKILKYVNEIFVQMIYKKSWFSRIPMIKSKSFAYRRLQCHYESVDERGEENGG